MIEPDRSGRIPFNTEVECVFTMITRILPSRWGDTLQLITSNSGIFLVDKRRIPEDELKKILNRTCYFQIGRTGTIKRLFDYIEYNGRY